MPRNRLMELISPLGRDALRVHQVSGSETLGEPFEYEIFVLSEKNDLDFDALLGKHITLDISLPDESSRYIDARVSKIGFVGSYGTRFRYRILARPWPWLLTRTSDCRIFQDLNVLDIVKEVFEDHKDVHFEICAYETYPKRNYCVQYRESDLAFVSRLLEEEGLYYYFRHEPEKHVLVLCDSVAAHPAVGAVRYSVDDARLRIVGDVLQHWNVDREIQTGTVALRDFDFEKPSVDLIVQQTEPRECDESGHECFDYPGGYLEHAAGRTSASMRLEAIQSAFEVVETGGNVRALACGDVVTVTGCLRPDQNREYLVVSAALDFRENIDDVTKLRRNRYFRARFKLIPSVVPFRTPRRTPRPVVQGPQTAMVVGPAGEEIYSDKYGRVKVQFHWDRLGKRDENSSCWIRVSQLWAGKGWGGMSLPRIGQEVIVDFLEGNPDRPIITGRVYNAEQMPPYELPAGTSVSGVKSKTHKGQGFNEMSFDDTAGKEKITIHGQYDMNTVVEHDQTSTVHNNRTDVVDVDDSETVGNNQTQTIGVDQTITIGSNQTISIGANRTESVGANETISIGAHRSETVGGGEDVTVSGGRTHTVNGMQSTTISAVETHTVGAARSHSVGGGEAINIGAAQAVTVGGAQVVSIGAVQSVSVGSLQSVTVGGPHKLTAAAISQTSKGPFKIKAGGTAIVEAPTIVLKAGGSKITMSSGGITIKASKITLKADGSVGVTAGGSIKLKGSNIGEN